MGGGKQADVSSPEEVQEDEGKRGSMGTFLTWTKGVEGVLPGQASRWRRGTAHRQLTPAPGRKITRGATTGSLGDSRRCSVNPDTSTNKETQASFSLKEMLVSENEGKRMHPRDFDFSRAMVLPAYLTIRAEPRVCM